MSEILQQSMLCIMGPTAVGKTDLALALAEHLPIEVISVDSTMVYRGLDIGSAKPTMDERRGIPHHLIDIRDVTAPYSAGDFYQDIADLIPAIQARGNHPVLVGGTMLYFNAIQNGIADLPEADPELRAKLLAQGNQLGWSVLHQRLTEVDPEAAKRIHPNDAQRIQRALEVYEITGRCITEMQQGKTGLPYRWCNVVLHTAQRATLHARIAQRFQVMLARGLLDELQPFFEREDVHANLPAMRAVGYRQAWQHLAGELSVEEMVECATVATRQLAKRQLTWLRRWSEAAWLDTTAGLPVSDLLGVLKIC